MNKGLQAERWALQHLQQQGLTLIVQNYRSRFGEIDLIMQDEKILVFVEVRMRRNRDFGGAAASITSSKQQRIIKTAQQYLGSLSQIPACRFDALLIDENGEKVQWLRDAFQAS